MATEIPMIYGAINSIMKEIDPISKGSKNKEQGFMFRGIDDIYNFVNPLLAKHGIFVTIKELEYHREERQSNRGNTLFSVHIKNEYTLFAKDGSSITTTMRGEAMDSGDKATSKAQSIAYKYMFLELFCIPTGEPHDPDANAHTVVGSRIPPTTANPDRTWLNITDREGNLTEDGEKYIAMLQEGAHTIESLNEMFRINKRDQDVLLASVNPQDSVPPSTPSAPRKATTDDGEDKPWLNATDKSGVISDLGKQVAFAIIDGKRTWDDLYLKHKISKKDKQAIEDHILSLSKPPVLPEDDEDFTEGLPF